MAFTTSVQNIISHIQANWLMPEKNTAFFGGTVIVHPNHLWIPIENNNSNAVANSPTEGPTHTHKHQNWRVSEGGLNLIKACRYFIYAWFFGHLLDFLIMFNCIRNQFTRQLKMVKMCLYILSTVTWGTSITTI